jgi:hypothetical protein
VTADRDAEAEDDGAVDAADRQAFVDSLYGSRKPERVVEEELEERRRY